MPQTNDTVCYVGGVIGVTHRDAVSADLDVPLLARFGPRALDVSGGLVAYCFGSVSGLGVAAALRIARIS